MTAQSTHPPRVRAIPGAGAARPVAIAGRDRFPVVGNRHSEAFATWAATYRPVQANPRPDAPFGGLLFDTSDEATAHVWAQPEGLVWTLISEDDVLALVPGFRHCDRLGHFVCAVEREASAPTEIVIG